MLTSTRGLIISGYSFRDKGINSWLIDWMDSSPRNKILLISPNTEKCIGLARPGIRENWTKWKDLERVKEISVPIEEVSWNQHRTNWPTAIIFNNVNFLMYRKVIHSL